MMIPDNVKLLIEKYQAGTISREELDSLNEWYHSFDDTIADLSFDADDTEKKLKERIMTRLMKTTGPENALAARAKRRRYISAAAAILLLLAGAGYFFISRQPGSSEKEPVLVAKPKPVNDIEPGGNRALLTLADNSVIILDSATNGIIGTQGETRIEKTKDGLLAYVVNGKLITEKDEAFYNTISTPRGGQYQVTLSDGTKVWLNAASSIRFPVIFTGEERRVEVTGETYFEVAKNDDKPFRVKAGASEVEVLGTHFNINAYDDEEAIKTTLLEGKVKVYASSVPGSQSARYLTPGQQSGITKAGKINVLNNADTEEAIAWINGRFQFRSAGLKSILRQIARWYDVDVEYRGNVDLSFTGQLNRSDNVSKVFEKLKLTGEVHFKIEDRKIIVSR